MALPESETVQPAGRPGNDVALATAVSRVDGPATHGYTLGVEKAELVSLCVPSKG